METDTLTLYLKRAPRPEVNVIVVYKNIENSKFARTNFTLQHSSQIGQFSPQEPTARTQGATGVLLPCQWYMSPHDSHGGGGGK